MPTIKNYTTVEQSRKLAAILPIESADMYYGYRKDKPNYLPYSDAEVINLCLPCWSLAALLYVIPERIIKNYYAPNLQKENGKYSIAYGDDELLCIADNPIDACVAMVEKLNELKVL